MQGTGYQNFRGWDLQVRKDGNWAEATWPWSWPWTLVWYFSEWDRKVWESFEPRQCSVCPNFCKRSFYSYIRELWEANHPRKVVGWGRVGGAFCKNEATDQEHTLKVSSGNRWGCWEVLRSGWWHLKGLAAIRTTSHSLQPRKQGLWVTHVQEEGLPHCYRGTSTQTTTCCLLEYFSKELNQKWSVLRLELATWVWGVSVSSSSFTCSTTTIPLRFSIWKPCLYVESKNIWSHRGCK